MYSLDPITADCYEGTTCLINKLGIRDENKLAQVEAAITLAKTAELERAPLKGGFDFSHYLSIHHFLFCDLYDWAGQVRKVNISKKGTRFVEANQIEQTAKACFDRLEKCGFFMDCTYDEFVEEIVDLYCTTNMLHPFREGNGRTQRIFLSQLIRHNGYEIHFSEIDTDELMMATIQAANGVTDWLMEIFRDAIKLQ